MAEEETHGVGREPLSLSLSSTAATECKHFSHLLSSSERYAVGVDGERGGDAAGEEGEGKKDEFYV